MKILSLATILILFACKSENRDLKKIIPIKNQEDSLSKNNSLSHKVLPAFFNEDIQIYEGIESNKSNSIKGTQGTEIYFKPKSFGEYSGNLKVELIEIYSIEKMILMNLSTTLKDEGVLETSGMVYIAVEDSTGKNLTPSKDFEIRFKENDKSMDLFYGNVSEGFVNWELAIDSKKTKKAEFTQEKTLKVVDGAFVITEDNDSIPYTEEVERTLKLENIIYSSSRLGWLNSDKLLTFEDLITLEIKTPDNSTGVVYSLVFYDVNSIIFGRKNSEDRIIFNNVPNNQKVSVIGLKMKDEVLYYNILDLDTYSNNSIEFPKLIETTESKLKVQLEDRFGNDIAKRPKPKF